MLLLGFSEDPGVYDRSLGWCVGYVVAPPRLRSFAGARGVRRPRSGLGDVDVRLADAAGLADSGHESHRPQVSFFGADSTGAQRASNMGGHAVVARARHREARRKINHFFLL